MGPYVHFELTRAWAVECGLAGVADRIARADVGYDWEHPAKASLVNITRHFAPWCYVWAWTYERRALDERSPEHLGRALHSVQDAASHGVLGLAHIRYRLGLGRDPDSWLGAPAAVRARIRERSLRLLCRYRARWSG